MITGATGHLGGAMSRALAEAGASVIVGSRMQDRAAAAADLLPRPGDAKHLGIALDYFDACSIERGVAEAIKNAGRIDVLVNNGYERITADWRDATGDQFNRQLANATGCFLLARRIHAHAVERGGGASIIMMGSMYGIAGSYPDAYAGICMASPAAYHVLKGGILSLTRHLAVYWAKDGVRVNCLSPGPFPAPTVDSRLMERLQAKSPMGRIGQPHELKGAIVFLASNASSYMTGQNLVIDGGWLAW
ncbi:MAG: SDR family oxidoreductase [Pirellulales bacterium]|nr:SDR family oxidoreductase [Pirellulales bacterium]